MQIVFKVLTVLFPDSFGDDKTKAATQALAPEIGRMTVAKFFNTELWSAEFARITGSKLRAEREEDLQDTLELYESTVSEVSAKLSNK